MGNLQKFIKRSVPGWFSVIIGSGWQALEHYDKIEKILPLPPWGLILAGGCWVIAGKVLRSPESAGEHPTQGAEVVVMRERTTTVEREYVMRRER